MMVNIEQLADSAKAFTNQPNFMRHVMFGLIAVIVSSIILQMQQDDILNTPSRQNAVSPGVLSYMINRIFQSTIVAMAAYINAIWTFVLRILGTTLGVGFGLGLACHIYDSLDDTHHRHGNSDDEINGKRRSTDVAAKIPASPYTISEDPNSYHSLMKSAGYQVDNTTLRAQMVRGERAAVATDANGARSGQHNNALPRPSIYKFNKGDTAYTRMKSMWPNLAPVINESLAKLTEFVLRDYVASWYGKVDENVPCESPVSTTLNDDKTAHALGTSVSSKNCINSSQIMNGDSTAEKQERRTTLASPSELSSSLHSTASTQSAHLSKSMPIDVNKDTLQQQSQSRTMVLTTTGTLPSPFIESLYISFAYLLGTVATRASENVNVFELLLLHLPHVLGKNLKVYRELKNAALEKKRRRDGNNTAIGRPGSKRGRDGRPSARNTSIGEGQSTSIPNQSHDLHSGEEVISEIAIIREYLLAGRLHRALTFGLDVPSLLFADPLAKDCLPSANYQHIQKRLTNEEDSVLEDRLLSDNSTLVSECELDYNRVMASKISKLVIPKSEIESSVVRTMLVEMLASCVLMPVMGCFVPDSVNGWLITGLNLVLDGGDTENTTEASVATESVTRVESEASLDGTERSLLSFSEGNHNHSPVDCDDMNVILETALGDEAISDVLGDESIASDFDETLFDDTDDASKLQDSTEQMAACAKSEQLITLLSMSIIELRNFVDFDDCRHAMEQNQDLEVDWDNHRAREAIRHLVLVIEAALLLGARPERKRSTRLPVQHASIREMVETTLEEENMTDGDDFEVDIDVVREERTYISNNVQHHNSISSVLMELTGDIDRFEKAVSTTEHTPSTDGDSVQDAEAVITPKPSELSTLRTLIAAWLHTGQAFKVLSIVSRCHEAILKPFYYKDAFVRRINYIDEFTRLLRQLDGIEILVDTTAVLASQCLIVTGGGLDNFERQLQNTINDEEGAPKTPVGGIFRSFVQNRDKVKRFASESFNLGKSDFDDQSHNPSKYLNDQGPPAYLHFNKNDIFSSSMRKERQRRLDQWFKETDQRENLEMVCRSKGCNEKEMLLHRELHHLARFFYTNTTEIKIEPTSAGGTNTKSETAANVTVKSIAPRRKVEVPEEDSSFLLRAQPRVLKPVAIHRDNKTSLACKIYVSMYEEPTIHPKTKRYYGGRYLRQCLLKYYPNDKTASVSIANDLTVLDRRVGQPSVEKILTRDFQNTRHSCLKVATSASLLASPLMEPNDFNACPRAGKALDFIYRIPFFDRPVVELGGKKFVIHDASSLLHHRASASCLELSDAALTAAIILRGSIGLNACSDQDDNPRSFSIQVSDGGSPLVLLRAGKDGTKEEARPYRPSFLRAALLVKSARREAQSQCVSHTLYLFVGFTQNTVLRLIKLQLTYCIKNGSARSSSKIKSDNWLQPTLNLLHFANSRRKEEQFLLRDLQLGMNHIDRAQLVRNGLLNPRYPTMLRGLTVKIIGAVEVKAPLTMDLLGAPTVTLFKIRCTAITEYIGEDDEHSSDDRSRSKSRYFREEWTVSRSLRDFAVFHKHIKSQVAPAEHSASTGAKLVGAATAISQSIVGVGHAATKKERGPLVPSLARANQVPLGLSAKKLVERRKKLLSEYLQYLTAPSNLLSRSPELLNFLGAYTSIFSSSSDNCTDDEFGREDGSRVELDTEKLKAGVVHVKPQTEQKRPDATPKQTNKRPVASTTPSTEASLEPVKTRPADSPQEVDKKQPNLTRRIAMMRSRGMNLRDVRRSVFRLLKDIFDLDNASFFRSRVISVIRTMSLAFTNVQDFHLMLFKYHIKYMNGEWVSGWIFYLVEMFWPNGVFYTKGPDLTEREQLELKVNSKKILERTLPLQLKAVLGRHSDEGLDLLHEMLQNRLVLKSIAYMLLDLVWAQIFPELVEFTTGAESLERET